MERMRGCRNYFQAFVDKHPKGPYRENAERIVQVLNSHIKREQKDRKRIKDLARQVSEQEQVIHTLRYKIEKLEEINRETEKKRHLLKGE
jgi:vacuolar-type H+-ATPase subunit I/STV1